jgi:putative ATP-dependent endonuclease of OLD family
LVNLPADGRNDRDLRLVRGSALDRLLADPALRARLEFELADDQLAGHLKDDAQKALKKLEGKFEKSSLPGDLGLGLTGGPGLSISALVGLMASSSDVALPLASWGAGTRRLAALSIADALQDEGPITIVDELERGLEAYRQRILVMSLQSSGRQVFLTTHSPVVLSEASKAAHAWYLDSSGTLGELGGPHLFRLRQKDPEAFFSRLTIACEGVTEVGFAESLLEWHFNNDIGGLGIHFTDCGGHAEALGVLKALTESGLAFAGVVDNEGTDQGSWQAVKGHLGDLLLQWPSSSLEEEVISRLKYDRLRDLIEDPEGEKTGKRLRTLADRLEISSKDWSDIVEAADDRLQTIITEAALGVVPEQFAEADKAKKKELKSHGRDWFKSRGGGEELFLKLHTLDLWEKFEPIVLPFVDAIRGAVGDEPEHDFGQ